MPSFVSLAVLVCALIITRIYNVYFQPSSILSAPDWSETWHSRSVFTPQELSQKYNGKLGNKSYLVILGEVYDVTGSEHYAEGSGYSVFVGQDNTAAFVTGRFDSSITDNDNVAGFSPEQMRGIEQWVVFYRTHDTYKFVGVVEGRYYHRNGSRTEQWKLARKAMLPEPKKEEPEFPSCNMKWDSNNGAVSWCDDGGVPRIAVKSTRCFCVPLDIARKRSAEFQPHKNCPETNIRCEIN